MVIDHDVVDVVHLRERARAEPLAAGPGAVVIRTEYLDLSRVPDRFREFSVNHARQPKRSAASPESLIATKRKWNRSPRHNHTAVVVTGRKRQTPHLIRSLLVC